MTPRYGRSILIGVNALFETLRIIRLQNCLMASVGVLVGAWMTWLTPVYVDALWAAAAAFFVCAAGNVGNDLADIEIDRISHPKRVLPRGGLSPAVAGRMVVVFNIVALGIALAINWIAALVVAVAIGLLVAYNMFLKRVPLLGNAVIAFLAGLTFISGGLAVDPVLAFALPGPLIAASFAFLLHLVREIVKDVEDIDGDSAVGVRTLPQIIGIQKALMVALLLLVALVILTILPVMAGWFGSAYKTIAIYFVDLPLLVLLILIWGTPSRRMLRVGSTGLKAGMLLGMVALILG